MALLVGCMEAVAVNSSLSLHTDGDDPSMVYLAVVEALVVTAQGPMPIASFRQLLADRQVRDPDEVVSALQTRGYIELDPQAGTVRAGPQLLALAQKLG